MATKYLDSSEVAEFAGIKPETVRWYHKRGLMPHADHYFGRTPVWKQETVEQWRKDMGEHDGTP